MVASEILSLYVKVRKICQDTLQADTRLAPSKGQETPFSSSEEVIKACASIYLPMPAFTKGLQDETFLTSPVLVQALGWGITLRAEDHPGGAASCIGGACSILPIVRRTGPRLLVDVVTLGKARLPDDMNQ